MTSRQHHSTYYVLYFIYLPRQQPPEEKSIHIAYCTWPLDKPHTRESHSQHITPPPSLSSLALRWDLPPLASLWDAFVLVLGRKCGFKCKKLWGYAIYSTLTL